VTDQLVCWRCGVALDRDLPMPLARRAECRGCGAELHVCRMCRFYDRSVAKSCREPVADEVQDKERANFCGWFTPRPGAWSGTSARPAADAIADLEALFGGARPAADPDPDDARRALEDLFGPGKPDDGGR
jgi:hypothetical protein